MLAGQASYRHLEDNLCGHVGPSLMAQIDATVVNVSLSNLAASLHSSLTTIQRVTSRYLLALALTLPLSGWLVDRIGARPFYLWSFSAFIVSSTAA
jgi:MFS family permease